MKKKTLLFLSLISLCLLSGCKKNSKTDTLTYAVFPYLPDPEYYQELIEQSWAKMEPNIQLIRRDWDCYFDKEPEGIDVIMFDAVMLSDLMEKGWIQSIDRKEIQMSEDIFPFALEGLSKDGKAYGIPVFLCGNFLIYDRADPLLSSAEHLTELADESELLVINADDSFNRPQYVIETLADKQGVPNPMPEGDPDEILSLIDQLAIQEHRNDTDQEVAEAYDSGSGQGYIGFSESMRFLNSRFDNTMIKSVSFSEEDNILMVYADAVAVTSGVKGSRYEKALKLMNIMADASILSELSLQNGTPQYLMLARKSPYAELKAKYPLYQRLDELAGNPDNHIILFRDLLTFPIQSAGW